MWIHNAAKDMQAGDVKPGGNSEAAPGDLRLLPRLRLAECPHRVVELLSIVSAPGRQLGV